MKRAPNTSIIDTPECKAEWKEASAMHIYDQLKQAGVPLDNHETDLYAKVTPESRAIVDAWEHRSIARTFVSQIDGALWFDLPFAYLPAWERKQSHGS